MAKPNLTTLDPKRLIKRIGRVVTEQEDEIYLSQPQTRKPGGKMKALLVGMKPEKRIRLPIERMVQGASLMGALAATKKEVRIGYIETETGMFNPEESDPTPYELITLRLYGELEKINNTEIPECITTITLEMPEGYVTSSAVSRTDLIRRRNWRESLRKGSRWKETDLTDVLPTEWFFKKGIYQSTA